MKRRAALAGSKTAVIFLLILLARSAAGAQDGVQKSNRQQVQQAQQGQNSGDRSDFLFIPALIALAAAQRQYRAQLAPTYTPSPATTTTTTTTVTTSTPIPAYVATQQPDSSSSSSSSGKPADPAGTVLDLSTGSTTASADSPAGSGVAGSSADPAGTVLDLTTGDTAAPAAAAAGATTTTISSSSSSQQAAGMLTVSGKPADPEGTVLDLTTGVKAAPAGTPVATGSTPSTVQPAVPTAPTPAPAGPAKPPAYTVSPGAPSDPPGTVLIMVPGTQAAAGPPSSTVSAAAPGSSSSSSGAGGNSMTVIAVTTTAPAGNASTVTGSSSDNNDDDNDTDGGNDGSSMTGQSNGQSDTDNDDDEEPVVSETPAGSQQPSTTLPTATPTPSVPVGGLPAVPAAAAAAAITPKTFIFEQKGATRKILIGCALPFEGNQRVIGEAVFEAARMAIMDKAATLLPGVTVNLTCINSKCVDIPTYNAVYDLAEEKAVAVLGEVCSGASVAAAGVSNAKKIPIISPSSTSPSLSQPDFFFRVVPSDTFQGSAIADLLVNSGHKNIGLVYEDTPYGYGLGFSFIASFTSHGGNVPVVVMFKKGQGNVADAIRQLQAGKASSTYPLDAAFVATGNVSFVADFLVAAKAANLGMQLYGGDSSANPELVEKIGARPSALSNFTVVAPFPGSAAFQQRFADLVKQGSADTLAAQSVYAARGYDAMTALLQAYAAAQGPKDGPAIVAALQRQNFTGVSGAVAFDKNGDLVATDKTYVFGQHTAKGGISVEGFVDIANDGVKVAAAAGR